MQAEYGSKDTDVLINAQDYNKTGILLTFESGEKRVLDINRLFAIPDDDHLSDAIKLRWKEMYERGDFFKYEINNGDLVFGGWVEIFKEDLKKQTTELSIYKHFEQSNRLFVHYGFKTLTACISDGRIVELGGYTEKEALDLIKEIMPYKEELEQLHKANRILLVH